ncbi:MAG: ubiquinone/menaquinone biosynthesis C-methylase UbiE [Arenicella sp.]|jgi:ubiquinone/menaquinone biosynthesis C-methylase UbiE
MSDYKKIKKYYDKYGADYHQERSDTYYYSFINEIETSVIEDVGRGKKTLEIGCGTGIILKQVSIIADEAWGMDLSSGMLENAREMNLNVVEGNAISIPFPDDSFDVVYSFKVLPHVIEIDKAMSEISRVLRNDGVAVLEFYNPISLKGLANKLAGALKKVYITYHSPKQVESLVSEHFKIEKVIGARIITPFAYIHKIPVLSTVVKFLEKALSTTFMAKFAGYYIVVLSHKQD